MRVTVGVEVEVEGAERTEGGRGRILRSEVEGAEAGKGCSVLAKAFLISLISGSGVAEGRRTRLPR